MRFPPRARSPVSTADGHTYERAAIEELLRTHSTSPQTNLPLERLDLVPNIVLRQAIAEYTAGW